MTTVQPLIIDELAQAMAATIEIAIPAFSQVGMTALLNAFNKLINHHANIVPAGPAGPNPAPLLPPPPVVIPNQ